MNPDHLLEIAQDLLRTGGGAARQAQLNRAISTAYYALFHAVCRLCVAKTVGTPRSTRHWEIVTPILRSVDHAAGRKVFARFAGDPTASDPLRVLSRAFLELQAARIAADYDPGPQHRATRRDAFDLLDQARSGLQALSGLANDEGLLLSVQLITKQR